MDDNSKSVSFPKFSDIKKAKQWFKENGIFRLDDIINNFIGKTNFNSETQTNSAYCVDFCSINIPEKEYFLLAKKLLKEIDQIFTLICNSIDIPPIEFETKINFVEKKYIN